MSTAPLAHRSLSLIPIPHDAVWSDKIHPLPSRVTVRCTGPVDRRVYAGLNRLVKSWSDETGDLFCWEAVTEPAQLEVHLEARSPEIPKLKDREDYTLEVGEERIVVHAATTVALLRSFETLKQLITKVHAGAGLPCGKIQDAPRFPWRGLMLDVCRHWQPLPVVLKQLDAMALVKLNVLHLHLSDDQGFRVECHAFPKLHEQGSDGHYFTHQELRQIIDHAANLGIRVVPEFDMPGHTQSWGVGYPEVMSAPGPYTLQRHWGIFDATLDPTKEQTFILVDGVLEEMCALFPDDYFHIGGDEVNGVHWKQNKEIQAFLQKHSLRGNEELQAFFNHRVIATLRRHGKVPVGWDEILHPTISGVIVQSWRGAEGLVSASRAGMQTLLSNGYYLDLMQSAAFHYRHDPIPAQSPLTPEERERILGGEATMWSEWTSSETIDSRIWPRVAAVAERLWSPSSVSDDDSLYRRLDSLIPRLKSLGLRHLDDRTELIAAYLGSRSNEPLVTAVADLLDYLQPVQVYRRGKCQPTFTQLTPLTSLADCALPDSPQGRRFAASVRKVISGEVDVSSLLHYSLQWTRTAKQLEAALHSIAPPVTELQMLALQLHAAAELLRTLVTIHKLPDEVPGKSAIAQVLALISTPQGAVEIPFVAPLELLHVAIVDQALRPQFTADSWFQHLNAQQTIPATF